LKSLTTREKILEVAGVLFSKKGYAGVSVREIAKEASVNLAAVNYHFQNKENLYWEVFFNGYKWIDEGVKKLDDGQISTRDLASNIFELFLDNGHSIVNCFKIILNDSFDFQVTEEYEEMTQFNYGPPGGHTLFDAITREVGESVPEVGRIWAMKGIFTYLVHWAMLMSTSHCKDMSCKDPLFSLDVKKKSVKLHVDAFLDYLKANPDSWEDFVTE
jgi:AcrR family transcriptional regulator